MGLVMSSVLAVIAGMVGKHYHFVIDYGTEYNKSIGTGKDMIRHYETV